MWRSGRRPRFDPAASPPPRRSIFNRVAMSSFLREPEHPLSTPRPARSLAGQGAKVLNGPEVWRSTAARRGNCRCSAASALASPRTRVVHRAADLARAAEEIGYPLLVKANVGGSGAGIMRFDSAAELAAVVAAGRRAAFGRPRAAGAGSSAGARRRDLAAGDARRPLPVRHRGAGAGQFDLCPADACGDERGTPIPMRAFDPPAEIVAAAERVAEAIGMDVGGVEVMVDDRDGTPKFYDINALSNFVAKPLRCSATTRTTGWSTGSRQDRGGTRMRFGYWMPVFGGWLRNDPRRGAVGKLGAVRDLTLRSEEAGWDLTLIAELFLNDIKGIESPRSTPGARRLRWRRSPPASS
jgi:hypothetical protein